MVLPAGSLAIGFLLVDLLISQLLLVVGLIAGAWISVFVVCRLVHCAFLFCFLFGLVVALVLIWFLADALFGWFGVSGFCCGYVALALWWLDVWFDFYWFCRFVLAILCCPYFGSGCVLRFWL